MAFDIKHAIVVIPLPALIGIMYLNVPLKACYRWLISGDMVMRHCFCAGSGSNLQMTRGSYILGRKSNCSRRAIGDHIVDLEGDVCCKSVFSWYANMVYQFLFPSLIAVG